MRPAVRLALAAATTLAVTLPLTPWSSGAALAAPTHPHGGAAYPSQAQVNKAKADVAAKKQSVDAIEASLQAANARMDAAQTAAEAAAEKYNGAQYALQQARSATLHAQAVQRAAVADVRAQRDGIVQLVTESYQNGTQLGTASALMSSDGPQGLMNRYGVVQSAGDSMTAAYQRYREASARAKKATVAATAAQKKQSKLTAETKQLAVEAGDAAAAAGAAASQIAVQRQQLVQALATAQHISFGLATKRTKALERLARERAAAARKAREDAAAKKAAQKAAQEAAKKARESKKNEPTDGDAAPPPSAGSSPAPVVDPAPNQSVAVQRAIAYAKAQLGKPYLWAAAGPDRFDCSGLTMQSWARGGKALPHYSVAQYAQSTPIRMADARAGDLLFWSNNGSPSGIHHVALYLGGGQFIEAPHTGAYVRYNSISNWYPDFVARP